MNSVHSPIQESEIAVHGLQGAKYHGDPERPDELQITLCREWLREFAKPNAAFDYDHNSYALKHFPEKWAGHYVTTGAFIVAAMREGYQPFRSGDQDAIFRIGIMESRMEPRAGAKRSGPNWPYRKTARWLGTPPHIVLHEARGRLARLGTVCISCPEFRDVRITL